jgi:D-aminopeptidase
MHISEEHVWEAIEAASDGEVPEGNVGAGTGTRAFGFKGGIGTSSRQLPDSLGGYTVGVLVQTNFGGVLTVDGRRVGESLGVYSFRRALATERREQSRAESADGTETRLSLDQQDPSGDDGSCMIVIATDAPLSDRNLERLARRAVLGLGRTGGFMSNGSGDFVIAFSTAYTLPESTSDDESNVKLLPNAAMSPLFLAVVESTEEAIYNSLVAAESMTGRNGNAAEALPHDELLEILRR